MGFNDLSEVEMRLFEYIKDGDFEGKKWSSKDAAEQMGIELEDIYLALSNMSKHIRDNIYIHYKDGGLRISAE